jgi:hypothetical protein
MRIKPNILALLLLIAAGCLRFRPDRLFVDAKETLQEPARLSAGVSELNMSRQIILAEGEFHNLARTGAGQVKIFTDNQGQRFLRLIEFETSPGKELTVCLMPNDSMNTNSEAQLLRYSVAPLKGIMGDQLYELPSWIDLSQGGEVIIWSRYSRITYAGAKLHFR